MAQLPSSPDRWYGPALAADAFSRAAGDFFGGLLESERRMQGIAGTEQNQAIQRAQEQRAAQMSPLELEQKKMQVEKMKKEMPNVGFETITDKYGNVYRYDTTTGALTPVLSGQVQRQVAGNRILTEGPQGVTSEMIPLTPRENLAKADLNKIELIKDPGQRRKFMEDWLAKNWDIVQSNSPLSKLYTDMARQYEAEQRRAQGAQFTTTTTETETPRKVINDPMARMQIENQLIPSWLNRGADGKGRSQMDAEFPGFDGPGNAVLDPATGRKITKRLAIELKLKELGYEAQVSWNDNLKKFVLGPIYSPGETTQRVTTKAPRQPDVPSSIQLETE